MAEFKNVHCLPGGIDVSLPIEAFDPSLNAPYVDIPVCNGCQFKWHLQNESAMEVLVAYTTNLELGAEIDINHTVKVIEDLNGHHHVLCNCGCSFKPVAVDDQN